MDESPFLNGEYQMFLTWNEIWRRILWDFHKMLNIDIKPSRVCSFLKSSFKSKVWIECVKYLQANANLRCSLIKYFIREKKIKFAKNYVVYQIKLAIFYSKQNFNKSCFARIRRGAK